MMKNISLRMRLTLSTIAVLSVIAVVITLVSLYNAQRMVEPISAGLYSMDYELHSIVIKSMDVAETTMSVVMPAQTLDGTLQSGTANAPSGSASDGFLPVQSDTSVIFTIPEEDSASGDVGGHAFQTVAATAAAIVEDGQALKESVSFLTLSVGDAKRSFDYVSLGIMVLMIALGGALVYFSLGFALKPVRTLSGNIRDISENQLNRRIEGLTAGDEINSLADSFNEMLERLERAFSAQKRFSAAAAHELKTPLATIRTNIDVLGMEEAPTDEEYRQTLEIVRRQTSRMSRLVDDLFAMSALQDYEKNDHIALDQMLKTIISDLSAISSGKGIDFSLQGCGCFVTGNSVMLMRAFSNILENAVKYNVDGGSVAILCQAQDDRVTVTIQDSGVGIPEPHLPHIFDPFYRVDDSRSRKLGGAGLGLSITREVLRYHGGEVSASSGSVGSAFTVTLPLTPADFDLK